uniref:SCP domain-containing protein n=1 Tax=Macrostomum lignano TaxID=282301 RepID=A0A1I8GPZ2_9PLAT
MNAFALVLLVAMATACCEARLLRLSQSQKMAFLKEHNRLRAQTAKGHTRGQPSASNMAELVWDDRLMRSANRWVRKCRVGHDRARDRRLPGFSWVGQNWAGGHSRDFTRKSCSKVCGHYTQVVWAKTTRVGCGVARCGRYPYHVVCNYATGGNFNNEFPYARGRPASRCGRRFRRRRNGLCVA